MKNWDEIIIDHSKWQDLVLLAEDKKNLNPLCCLNSTGYASISSMYTKLEETNKLPSGFIGEGYPHVTKIFEILRKDDLTLRNAYENYQYRDVLEAIYQCNIILSNCNITKISTINILELGAGYGRLAMPFLYYLKNCTYIGLDYSPLSLILASEFLPQVIDSRIRKWDNINPIVDFDYISLPTWQMNVIENTHFNLFIAINMFRKITKEAKDYFISRMKPESFFYFLGDDTDFIIPENFKKIFEETNNYGFGYFTHKIWRVE